MLWRNRTFLYALGFTLLQQLLLALSTYCIARAGGALPAGDIRHVLRLVSLFFLCALLAYACSALATVCATRAAHQSWQEYSRHLLSIATGSLQYACDRNRRAIAQWLAGEAQSTLAHACDFHLDLVSVSLNILFTLAVFYLAVGWEIGTAIAASLLISLGSALALRHRIESVAGSMQQRRLQALLCLEPAWNGAMFGNRRMRAAGLGRWETRLRCYFAEVHRHVLLEQVLACTPIVLATLALLALLQWTDLFTASLAGALVAVLPRSLQVLGNVHSLSVYLSQFFLVRARLRNLNGFFSGLEKYAMYETSLDAISIIGEQHRLWQPGELLAALRHKRLACGRLRVTGANGSGKSTFLKIIKEQMPDALLLTPEIHFLDASSGRSTGQSRIQEIEHVLAQAPPVLMLDEWDANLDGRHRRRIDALLDDAARQRVVIEVRHLPSGVGAEPGPAGKKPGDQAA